MSRLNNIVLVGFMGTGKSAVGSLLAKRLGFPFLDLDEEIARGAGRSIPQIFATEGEAGFRRRESGAVQEVAKLNSHVIATGGGVLLEESNVRALKASGRLICLTARPEVIIERTLSVLSLRPLLQGANPRQRIEELLMLRALSYSKADVTIDTSDRTVQEVVEEIMKWIDANSSLR